MANPYFKFKLFSIQQDRCAMKVTTDACLFGGWVAENILGENDPDKRLLDVGTGTGLLSLMIAQKHPSIKIDTLEIDGPAFEQARENFVSSPLGNNIKAWKADIREFTPDQKYDLIISNPPFYENELKSPDLKKNIALHSEDFSIAILMDFIAGWLRPNGQFYLLLPYKRNEEIRKMLTEKRMTISDIVFVRPITGKEYSRMMIKGAPSNARQVETKISDMTIFEKEQKYSKEFVELLKDYYLNL